MLDRIAERKQVAEAAERIEREQSPEIEYADPAVAKAKAHWREMTEAAERARDALAAAITARRAKVSEADRRIIREAKKRNPDLVLLETDGELMPARCMVSGLAIFAGDELVGDVESGAAVLKRAVTVAAHIAADIARRVASRNLASLSMMIWATPAFVHALADLADAPIMALG